MMDKYERFLAVGIFVIVSLCSWMAWYIKYHGPYMKVRLDNGQVVECRAVKVQSAKMERRRPCGETFYWCKGDTSYPCQKHAVRLKSDPVKEGLSLKNPTWVIQQ